MPLANSDQTSRANRGVPPPGALEPSRTSRGGCLDKILLVGAALLVCITGGAAFWLAEEYHLNPAWVFVGWNSIWLAPLFIRDFRTHLRKPAFVAFLLARALIHGLLVATLTRWMSVFAMVPILAVEFTVGLVLADYMFGIDRSESTNSDFRTPEVNGR